MPQAFYLIAILVAVKFASIDVWLKILGINAAITITSALDMGRTQLIISGRSHSSLSIVSYLFLFVIVGTGIAIYNVELSLLIVALSVLSGLLTVYAQHNAALFTVRGKDNEYQILQILISISRSISVVVASAFDNPYCLPVIYMILLFLTFIKIGRIHLDKKNHLSTPLFSDKSKISFISIVGLVSISIDRLLFYPQIPDVLIKPYSIISTIFIGLMFISALRFRIDNMHGIDLFRMKKIIYISYLLVAIVVLASCYLYSVKIDNNQPAIYCFVMALWGLLNIYSQKLYRDDFVRATQTARVVSMLVTIAAVIILLFTRPANSVLIFWCFMVISQLLYLAIKTFPIRFTINCRGL